MIDHLIYVLWHDYWKPLLIDIGYILLGVGVVTAVVMGMIFFTIYLERAIGG